MCIPQWMGIAPVVDFTQGVVRGNSQGIAITKGVNFKQKGWYHEMARGGFHAMVDITRLECFDLMRFH